MERQIVLTADGSTTIQLANGDSYHSMHGAIQESNHVYINAGLDSYATLHPEKKELRVFETGMGTGLNALLTALYASAHKIHISYHASEPYPLAKKEYEALNYSTQVDDGGLFQKIHTCAWDDSPGMLSEYFDITKYKAPLLECKPPGKFDVIYHDAFSPTTVNELWTQSVFIQLYDMLYPGGILTTYCSKVVVQHAMKEAGFTIQKIAGPWGKRDILRAVK